MRLDKLLADSGYGTRSEVRKLILRGLVCVDGKTIKDAGTHVDKDSNITVGGQAGQITDKLYFVFDKPDEVLTAMEDKRLPHVGQYIPQELIGRKLSPVGRLDYHTTGLLIITNDGELSHRLTSPKYKIPKVYSVTYEGEPLSQEHIDEALSGITLTDMDKKVELRPAKLELKDNNQCLLTLTEGKTHEVRRIIAHWGRSVITLRRVELGPIRLTETNPGLLRQTTKEELEALLSAVNLIN